MTISDHRERSEGEETLLVKKKIVGSDCEKDSGAQESNSSDSDRLQQDGDHQLVMVEQKEDHCMQPTKARKRDHFYYVMTIQWNQLNNSHLWKEIALKHILKINRPRGVSPNVQTDCYFGTSHLSHIIIHLQHQPLDL